MNIQNLLPKLLLAAFGVALVIMLSGYFKGYDSSISWNVTTIAESQEFPVHQFSKGPFLLTFSGEKFTLAESFSAGPIERTGTADRLLLVLITAGICLILASITYLSRFWFIVLTGLFIFFVISIRLQDIGLFGFSSSSSIGVILILIAYVIPAYLLHAFYVHVSAGWRFLAFLLVSILIVLFGGVGAVELQDQVIAGGYFGLVILSLLFLLLISEEIIFGILFLITRSKGGKNNHIHFILFSTVYLLFIALYYANKSGFVKIELTYFDPYILMAVSSLLTFWGLKFRKALYENYLGFGQALMLFTGTGIVVFAFLGLSFFRGNDPVYEGLHYFILYTHLGFGMMFFFYLLLNFINPMAQGLQVYKIAYKEQNLPYFTVRLAGLVTVVAFFFLSNKEPFLLFRAGHFNFLGVQAEQQDQSLLAHGYYREGSIYGHDNHFSNYKLAYKALQEGEIGDSEYHFRRATLRFPSSQSFVNHAGTLARQDETTPSLVSLKNGLRYFPKNDQLLNNLGLIYTDLGDLRQATAYFEQAQSGSEWNHASRVNLWKVRIPEDKEQIQKDFSDGNLAVKANILARLLNTGIDPVLNFDSTYLSPSYPLHRLAFLINSTWYFPNAEINGHLEEAFSGVTDEGMYYAARHAAALSHYLKGNINAALRALDQLQFEAETGSGGQYLNEMGQIALGEHALEIALDLFDRAFAKGNREALLNKAATLMEMGRLDEAQTWVNHLVELDSSYKPLATDLEALQNRENLSQDQQLTRLYYNYPGYSLAELSALLAESKEGFVSSLWQKISKELLQQGDLITLQEYEDLFRSYLPEEEFFETDLLQDLADNGELKTTGIHPVYEIMNLKDSSKIAAALYELASRNALNGPLVLGISTILKGYDSQKAYDLLVTAIDINRTSVVLHKSYVMIALESGLPDYARYTLKKLESMMSETEYGKFNQLVEQKEQQIEASAPW